MRTIAIVHVCFLKMAARESVNRRKCLIFTCFKERGLIQFQRRSEMEDRECFAFGSTSEETVGCLYCDYLSPFVLTEL